MQNKAIIYADLHNVRNEKKPAVPPPPSSHVIYSDVQQFQNVCNTDRLV